MKKHDVVRRIMILMVHTIIFMVCVSSCQNPAACETVEYEDYHEPIQYEAPEVNQESTEDETQGPPAVQEAQESAIDEEEPVIEEEEHEYTLIGSWRRDFDGHYEVYEFSEELLITSCDGTVNGEYYIDIDMETWTLTVIDIGLVLEFELLYDDVVGEFLVLNGYEYRRVAEW